MFELLPYIWQHTKLLPYIVNCFIWKSQLCKSTIICWTTFAISWLHGILLWPFRLFYFAVTNQSVNLWNFSTSNDSQRLYGIQSLVPWILGLLEWEKFNMRSLQHRVWGEQPPIRLAIKISYILPNTVKNGKTSNLFSHLWNTMFVCIWKTTAWPSWNNEKVNVLVCDTRNFIIENYSVTSILYLYHINFDKLKYHPSLLGSI